MKPTYRVTGACAMCGSCQAACPNRAIEMDARGTRILPERCLGCGRCYLDCPSEAIVIVTGKEDHAGT